MKDVTPHRRTGRSRLVLGLALSGLGILMLAGNLGYDLPLGWWRYFPLPLLALGLWGLLFPSRHLDRSGGIWLLASGGYCLIGVFDLFDLGWSGAWPLFVIAAGASFMVGRHESAERRPPPSVTGGDA